MQKDQKGKNRPLVLFFILIALVALANGLSDSVYANYYKDVYQVTSVQRGFIEFPRELPGILCVLLITLLSFLGDLQLALLAQLLALVGVTVLGLTTPPFSLMLVFLFINSLGMHLFMPLSDSIGMALAEPGQLGKRIGQYASVKSAMGFLAALMVFFGFRSGFFSFHTPVKRVFLFSAFFFLLASVAAFLLVRCNRRPNAPKKKLQLIFRRQYKYYYLLTILHGVQKQIGYVYGTWVIVDLLLKGADTTALLSITASFLCIFFLNFLGRWMDKYGIKKMMYVDALTFIGVYIVYGFVVWGITSEVLPLSGYTPVLIYVLFILDRFSMQIGVVKSMYLRSIALDPQEVTATLATGTSLDHCVSIVAAILGGYVWAQWGSQWVFFMAAVFSMGNLIIARLADPEKERAYALQYRKEHGIE